LHYDKQIFQRGLPSRHFANLCALTLYLLLGTPAAWAQSSNPQGADAQQSQLRLAVHGTANMSEIAGVLAEFRRQNPDVLLEYSEKSSTELFDAAVDRRDGKARVDVIWSSAMDLQIKLANDGYATEYRSPEADGIPDWARWKDRAYGVTAEPVVIIYNKRLLREALVPRDHAELLRLLTEQSAVFRGRIATYDPEMSGTGLLFITQDVRITSQTWKLVAAMARAGVRLFASSDTMIDRVGTGELLLAYNVLGSYAQERAKRNPDLGVVFPADYTLLLSRIALIPESASQPKLAGRFIDLLLSRTGQRLLTQHSLGSVRTDIKPSAATLNAVRAVRPISLSIDLLTYQDHAKRQRFIRDWRDALGVR
jgi:iron(III) transport system substrate-binding protein